MSYIETLTDTQRKTIAMLVAKMSSKGITSDYMRAAILAVISKESNFIPKSEKGYGNTANERIRKIFGSRVVDLSEEQLTELKKDDKAFFDKLYGGRYGNAANEGYKYRGRGFNQLTFKANYEAIYNDIGIDIVSSPDLLNTIEVAGEVVIWFFIKQLISKANKLALYNMSDFNDAKTLQDACGAAYHANTGWGKTKEEIAKDRTGGYKLSFERVESIFEHIKQIV